MSQSRKFIPGTNARRSSTNRGTNDRKRLEDMKISGIKSPVAEKSGNTSFDVALAGSVRPPEKPGLPAIHMDGKSPRTVITPRLAVMRKEAKTENRLGGGKQSESNINSVGSSRSLTSPRNIVKRQDLVAKSSRTVMPMHEYTIKPVIPAKTAELLDIARAMHRDQFATRVKKLFDPEREAALQAIESGVYVAWRCEGNDFDCIRVARDSRCFCGHTLSEHESFQEKGKQRLKCLFGNCICKQFAFIPSRPEEIGEWWLQKRRGFEVASWRAKCRCKHDHEQHSPNKSRKCNVSKCSCFAFDSNFLCAACDKHWEEHKTCFDDLNSRQEKDLPYGEAYLPFNELPQLRNIVLTGNEDDNSTYDAIASGPYAIPRQQPTQLALMLQGKKR